MQPKEQSPVCEKCGFDERNLNGYGQLPIGTVLMKQYVIGRVLGQGGFGITYIGWDRLLQIPVAIKEYFPTGIVHRDLRYGPQVECIGKDQDVFEKHRDRFLKEARTLAQLSTVPEIVQIKNFFVANNTAYIVMEYVQGITLKTYLKNLGRPMTVPEALEIMKPVLQGLSKVHDHQLVHRDISPDNIMLPGPGSVKLIDFGTARNMDESMRSKSTESILKPGFAPLEQYNSKGNLGTWTDVYAVSATFHYLLTGKLPPDAPTRIEEGDSLPLLERVPTMTPRVLRALQAGMAIRAMDRIQTLPELQERLYTPEKKTVKTVKKTSAPEGKNRNKSAGSGRKTQTKPEKKKNKFVLPIAAAVLAVAAVVVLTLMPKGQQPEQESVSVQETAPVQAARPQPTQEAAPVISVEEPVSLTVMAAQYSSGSAQWWAEFVEGFEEAYPNVDLQVDIVSWSDIYTVADERAASGNAPDILNLDVYKPYWDQGLLLPVDAYLSPETRDKFYPHMLEYSAAEGKVWAVPDLSTSRAMFCNMEILEAAGAEVPTTWQELTETCRRIKAYDPSVYPWGVDMTTDDGHACFAYYTFNNGGGFLDADGNWHLDSEKNAEAVRFVTGLVKDDLTNPDPITETRYDLQDMFQNGKVAMMIATNHMAYQIESAGISMDYQIFPIPVNTAAPSVSPVFMDRFMVFDNGQSKAELAAITCFFDFFYEDRRHVEWTSMEGYLPATRSGAQYLGQLDPKQAVWDVILDNSVMYPTELSGWPQVKIGIIGVQQEGLVGADPEVLLKNLQVSVAG